MSEKQIPQLCADKKDCCGCTACMTVCPVNAISMQSDENGFRYPKIDESKCLRCGKCLTACSFKKDAATTDNKELPKVYAVRMKDINVVSSSSSGGAFTAISDWVLEQQGAVASAIYDYASHTLKYRLYTDKQTRDEARGSKYVHPVLGNIYSKCVQWMKENPEKPLLFLGLGCQIAGFRKVLEANRLGDQAILVDLICHGTPSPQLWTDYIHSLECAHNGKAEYVTFKDKRNGWKDPYAFARIAGKEVPLDAYSCWFYENLSQRDSCFHCPYARLKRASDLTIGDYWGIENALPDFYDTAGNSLVLVQSPKGAKIFNAICDSIHFAESSVPDCMQPRLETPGEPNPRREKFWRDYRVKGIPYLSKHYREDGKTKILVKRVIRKAKRIVRKLIG